MERSHGVIPLRKGKVFLTQHRAGHWGFPKGHPEGDETPQETAARELAEETGLEVVRFLSDKPYSEEYTLEREGRPVDKRVEYYLAEVAGEVTLQPEEVLEGGWFTPEAAAQQVTYPQAKALCKKIIQDLVSSRKSSFEN